MIHAKRWGTRATPSCWGAYKSYDATEFIRTCKEMKGWLI